MNAALRRLVRERAGDRCEYCRLPQRCALVVRFHIEHIRSKQHGGSDEPGNLAFACNRCNLNKGPNLSGIDRRTDELVPLYDPRRERWDAHFAFQGATIVGVTPQGRATERLLCMNEPDRVRLREELIARGESP